MLSILPMRQLEDEMGLPGPVGPLVLAVWRRPLGQGRAAEEDPRQNHRGEDRDADHVQDDVLVLGEVTEEEPASAQLQEGEAHVHPGDQELCAVVVHGWCWTLARATHLVMTARGRHSRHPDDFQTFLQVNVPDSEYFMELVRCRLGQEVVTAHADIRFNPEES